MNDVRQLAVSGEQRTRRVNHYLKRAATQAAARYESDHHDLHPLPKRSEREQIEVELADAAKPTVSSESKRVASFTAGERPPLKFKGTVVVTALEDEAEATEAPLSTARKVSEEEVDVEKKVKKADGHDRRQSSPTEQATRHVAVKDTSAGKKRSKASNAKHANKTSKEHHVTVSSDEPAIEHVSATDEQGQRRTLLQRKGVIGMERSSEATITPVPADIQPAEEEVASGVTNSVTGLSLAIFGIATLVTIGLLGAEIRIVSTVSGSETEYHFSIAKLFDNVTSLKEALFAQVSSNR